MSYPSYLVHYNQNHSAKNGQFISGDGDGDGISNDHKNQKKTTSKKSGLTMGQKAAIAGGAMKYVVGAAGVALTAVGAVKAIKFGKQIVDAMEELDLKNFGFISPDWVTADYVHPDYVRGEYVRGEYVRGEYV